MNGHPVVEVKQFKGMNITGNTLTINVFRDRLALWLPFEMQDDSEEEEEEGKRGQMIFVEERPR